ncbi:hypothetical protein A3F00_04265 [Candidatus Daviesbacteria bacterium RIFCSPHIGHO2_12_FULL_37_11]|uniref:Rod shape-determining protein MreD n=1 Tax=Candidatus Daviesbacteria bacterium RIFCSPHIGHO2_12_FULL_37_11 TaxID=1797777 RepID=A0A1F5K9R3_9BACT|nr:MAG: hypothetical protein A2111_02610 [Candidatus Daviesbacteria bacterium GWA1_38_6]OGE16115.1 MAG: hypothetical protein A2769_03435 [Candidatus Daviesbacteria bacterium RIFCSPHIGHO2_01_FULL_37_27]OGE37639.1 MAG: hypothetical protein A3F00_04265 [Candidatus Daviesbacteria bacterium RIFCSPHIGHO2_12_FULL_37_11]OGE45396.1 MAG: hypothetical protein A3B39_04665 [Candidatus Daviesbacteria bacterium RIFCSPLOWO2_01_FULL_37_10]
MKTLIVVLILLSFIQVTLVPLNLVLLVLILRAYLYPEKINLYLGFFLGLLISFLESQALGVYSLAYVVFIQSIQMFRKAQFAMHYFVMIPSIVLILSLNLIFPQAVSGSTINLWPDILKETLLIIPVFFIIKVWEERFVVKPEVKIRF